MKRNYWSKDRILAAARKCKNRSEFLRSYASAYSVAQRQGWLDECTAHMPRTHKRSHWSKERVLETARKYRTRAEFRASCPGAYSAASREGYFYSIEFPDGSVYVGKPESTTRRFRQFCCPNCGHTWESKKK